MKGKLLQKSIAVILVICMTMVNFLFVATNMVYALSDSEVSMESGKVVFDAYFKNGDGNKVYTKDAKISEGAILYTKIKLQSGVLKDAKITINNANFKLPVIIDSPYVAGVNNVTKEIKLVDLDGSYVNDIELEIPVTFERQSTMAVDYFVKDNSIVFSGEYKTSETFKSVTGTITTHLAWYDEVKVEWVDAFEKSIFESDKVILQENIESGTNNLPKVSDKIVVTAPKVLDKVPNKIVILKNGKKVNEFLDKASFELTFNYIENNMIDWSRDTDTYKIIYLYEQQVASEKIPTAISKGTAKVFTTIFGYEDKVKESKEFSTDVGYNNGHIVSIDAEVLSTNIYKGFMYANSNAGTKYDEKYVAEISDAESINSVTVEFVEDKFHTEAQEISTNNKTVYKTIKISKDDFTRILGENGTISIQNDGGQELDVLNTAKVDEQGNIVSKELNTNKIKIVASKPVEEGKLAIVATKAILGNADLSAETISAIKSIETTVKVTTNKDAEGETASVTTELKQPKQEASLTMVNNNSNILSTEKVNHVEFQAKLKTGTEDTYLYKNPTIKLELPEGIEKIENVDAQALFAENNLTVKNVKATDNKTIFVEIEGESTTFDNKVTEGIVVTISADLTLNRFQTNRTATVKMEYTNENSLSNTAEGENTVTINVEIQSPYQFISESVLQGTAEDLTVSNTVKNNSGKAVVGIKMIGVMPNKETAKAEFEAKLKENLEAKIISDGNDRVFSKEAIEIEYSTDGENWTTNIENAKYFRLNFGDDSTLNNGETLVVSYKLTNIKQTLSTYFAYTAEGKQEKIEVPVNQDKSNFTGVVIPDEPQTEDPQNEEPQTDEPTGTEEKTEKISVKVIATTGNKEVKNGDEVEEGQVIRYKYEITNNSDEALTDIHFNAKHTNVNLFKYEAFKQIDTSGESEERTFTIETETDKDEVSTTIELKAKETKTFSYQARVKENVNVIKANSKITGTNIDEITLSEITNTVKTGKLKLEIFNNKAMEYPISKGVAIHNLLKTTNITNEMLEDVMVYMDIPEEFELYSIREANTQGYTVISNKDNKVVIKIDKIAAKNTKEVQISLRLKEAKPTRKNIPLSYSASIGDNMYYSNQLQQPVINSYVTTAEVTQTSNIKEETVKTGDKLTYEITIKNTGDYKDNFMVSDYVPKAAVIQNVYVINGEQQTRITEIEDNAVLTTITIEPHKEAKLVIETKIDERKTGRETITNYAKISGYAIEEELKTNEITYKLQANIKTPNDDNSNGEGTGTETTDDDGRIDGKITVKNSISGLVWLDANKNGVRDTSEKALSGIAVKLVNTQTNQFVKDENGKSLQVTTGTDGKYLFEGIETGKYMVVFKYDNVKYRNTEYRKATATETTNSDIITSKINSDNSQTRYGVTDTLELNDKSLENIDAGLIENEIFDLSLSKYISKITVQNSSGTVVQQYDRTQLAKVEIDAKNLAGSTVLVEYTIEVKNEGELAGYVNEIVDYMPKDLSFNSEINKTWYKSTDGNVHTTTLSKELLNPGETKQVTLVLTKSMTENNTGITTNKAEIAKASNDLSIPDSNKQNDTSKAEMIVSIRTGVEYTVGVISGIVLITGLGIVIYTKKRKEARHE